MKDILRKILSTMLVCCMLLSSCPSAVFVYAEEVTEQPAEAEPVSESEPEPEPEAEPAPISEDEADEPVLASEEETGEEPEVEEEPEQEVPAEPAPVDSASEEEPAEAEEPAKDESQQESEPVPEATAEPTPESTPEPTAEPTHTATAEMPAATAEPTPEAEPSIVSFSDVHQNITVEYGTPEEKIGLPSKIKANWSDGTTGEVSVSWSCTDDGSGGAAYVPEHKNSDAIYIFRAKLAEDVLCDVELPVIRVSYAARLEPAEEEKPLTLEDVYVDVPVLKAADVELWFTIHPEYVIGLSRADDEDAEETTKEPDILKFREELPEEQEEDEEEEKKFKILVFSELMDGEDYDVWAKTVEGKTWSKIDLYSVIVPAANLNLNGEALEGDVVSLNDILSVEVNFEDPAIEWYRGSAEEAVADGAEYTVTEADVSVGTITCKVRAGEEVVCAVVLNVASPAQEEVIPEKEAPAEEVQDEAQEEPEIQGEIPEDEEPQGEEVNQDEAQPETGEEEILVEEAAVYLAVEPELPQLSIDYESDTLVIVPATVEQLKSYRVVCGDVDIAEAWPQGEGLRIALDQFADGGTAEVTIVYEIEGEDVSVGPATITLPVAQVLTAEEVSAANVQLDGQKASCAEGYELRLVAEDGSAVEMVGGQFAGMQDGESYVLQLRAKGSNADARLASKWVDTGKTVIAAVPNAVFNIYAPNGQLAEESRIFIGDALNAQLQLENEETALSGDVVYGWIRERADGRRETLCQGGWDAVNTYTVVAEDAACSLFFYAASALEGWTIASAKALVGSELVQLAVDYESEVVTATLLGEESCDLKIEGGTDAESATGTKTITAALSDILSDIETTDEELKLHLSREDKETVTVTFRLKARPAFEGESVTISVGEITETTAQLSCSDSACQLGLTYGGETFWADETGLVSGLSSDSNKEYRAIARRRGSNAGAVFASKSVPGVDETGAQLVVRVKDAFRVEIADPLCDANGIPYQYSATVSAAAEAQNISYVWYAVDLAGSETKLAETSGEDNYISLTEDHKKRMFFAQLKVVATDPASGDTAADVYEGFYTAGLACSIDYVNEALVFTAPSAPAEECALHMGEAVPAVWSAGESQLSVPLSEHGLPSDSAGEQDYYLAHEERGVQTSVQRIAIPARPVPNTAGLTAVAEGSTAKVTGVPVGCRLGYDQTGAGAPAEASVDASGAASWRIEDTGKATNVYLKTPASNDAGAECFASGWTLAATIQPGMGFTVAETVIFGETVTAKPNGNYSDVQWQWKRGGDAISGAVSASYKPVGEDVGTKLSVTMTSGGVSVTREVYVEVGAPKVKVNYVDETVTLSAAGALPKGWSIRAYDEDGNYVTKTWTSGKESMTFTLKALGVDPDKHASSAPDYKAEFCFANSANGKMASITLPTRPKYSGSGVDWAKSKFISAVGVSFVYDQENEILAMSLEKEKQPNLALGTGPVIDGLQENTVYRIWLQQKAVSGKSFASEWGVQQYGLRMKAYEVVTATLKNKTLIWNPKANHSMEMSFSDEDVTMDDITVTWFDSKGKQLDGVPANIGSYTVKIALSEEESKWHVLKAAEFPVTVAPLVMTARNTTVTCEAMTYNSKEQLPQRLKITVGGVEVPTTEFTVGKIKNQNYVMAGSHTASVIGNGNVTGSVNMIYSINKAKPGTIIWPTAGKITYGKSLSASKLSGGSTGLGSFAWENGSIIPSAGTKQYRVVFTPADVTNYDWSGVEVRRLVSVTITSGSSSSGGGSGSSGGSSGDDYNYDYDDDSGYSTESGVDEGQVDAMNASEQLAGDYMNRFGRSATDALEIVFDVANRPMDYELLPILRYPEVEEEQAAQMTEEELLAAMEPNHTFMVIAQGDEEGETVPRILRLSLELLDYLHSDLEFKSLLLRNGKADAVIPMAELLTGEVNRLAAHMLANAEAEIDLQNLDLAALYPEDVILSEDELGQLWVEVRIEPVAYAEETEAGEITREAWAVSAWLCSETMKQEISAMMPGFELCLDVKGMYEEANRDAFFAGNAIVRIDELATKQVLESELSLVPAVLPGNQPDESEHYRVTMPNESYFSVWADYTSNMGLGSYRSEVLRTSCVGGGLYMISEKGAEAASAGE